MILHLSYFFRHYANEFVGIQEVKSMLEFVEKSFPDLVKEVTRLIPLQKMTDIFKRLIQEQISIKDLKNNFGSLERMGPNRKRYSPPNGICPLFLKALHKLQILARPIGFVCIYSRS